MGQEIYPRGQGSLSVKVTSELYPNWPEGGGHEICPKQKGQHVHRSCSRNALGTFGAQWEGQCGWSRENERERGRNCDVRCQRGLHPVES